MMCVDGSNNFGGALCIMNEYLLSCIVFHEKEYKDKLCGVASYSSQNKGLRNKE